MPVLSFYFHVLILANVAEICKALKTRDVSVFDKYIAEYSRNPAFIASDSEGNTPLIWAVIGGYFQIVQKLITAGFDLDKMNKNGEPTLAIAVNVEKKEVITTIQQS